MQKQVKDKSKEKEPYSLFGKKKKLSSSMASQGITLPFTIFLIILGLLVIWIGDY